MNPLHSIGRDGSVTLAVRREGLLDAAAVAAALPSPSFWLDSARQAYGSGRFSYLGHGPLVAHTLDEVQALLRAGATEPLDVPFDLQGGLVGVLGYEAKGVAGLDTGRPDTASAWIAAHRLVVLDHEQGCTWLLAHHDGSGEDAARHWLATGPTLADPPEALAPQPVSRTDLAAALGRGVARYRDDVEACLAALRAGESYEVCLTDELTVTIDDRDLARYLALRAANPAPYGALLRLPGRTLLGSSPELFLRVDHEGRAASAPIKGTAPRCGDDDAERAALAADPKVRAENLMIVDLVRNDLHRVGTDVRVDPFCAVQTHATVHQVVSSVHARLRTDAVDAVRALFPPGSMTGAPKHRTMTIIDALEGRPRGAYAGALGWFSLTGACELSVVIRTGVRVGDRLTIGAGGAIVLDSQVDAEVDEMLDKAWATARGLA